MDKTGNNYLFVLYAASIRQCEAQYDMESWHCQLIICLLAEVWAVIGLHSALPFKPMDQTLAVNEMPRLFSWHSFRNTLAFLALSFLGIFVCISFKCIYED